MGIQILTPGAFTSIQDEGRFGYMQSGVGSGGVMDQMSYRAANRLVGNQNGEAVIEMTLIGPSIRFDQDAAIALTGADMQAKLDNMPVPLGKVIHVKSGQILTAGTARNGCRGYLAIGGGVDVPKVMGSRSTNVKCHLGGYKGRILCAGDDIPIGTRDYCEEGILSSDAKTTSYNQRPFLQKVKVRVVAGPQENMFTEEGLQNFYGKTYVVTAESDRMGIRLDGPAVMDKNGVDIVSDGIVFGSVQVPKSGKPIILMADHQTTGGYAKIATVCSFDLPLLAQLLPGAEVSFQKISVEKAQELARHPARQRQSDHLVLVPKRNAEGTVRRNGWRKPTWKR